MVTIDLTNLPAWMRSLTADETDDDEPDGSLEDAERRKRTGRTHFPQRRRDVRA